MIEQPLTGGNVTPVVRIGETVRRSPGPWTTGVHALLRHLETQDFPFAPHVLGRDESGREILSYIDGHAGFVDRHHLVPGNLWSDQVLEESAQALRALHDATLGFIPPADASWQVVYPDSECHEVICHNDIAPYNSVFRDDHFVGFIDFDTAGPGPRIWDVVYAAYRYVPLVPDEALASMGISSGHDRGRRLRLLCDTYGLEDRATFVDILVQRIDAVETMLVNGARNGIAGYQQVLAEGGHLEALHRDSAWVKRHREELQRWLTDPHL